MPRAADLNSDSDHDKVQTGLTKKTYSSKKRRGMSGSGSEIEEVEKEVHEEPEETAPEDEEGGDDDEEEEEYEIEKILDAKKGQFTGGRMGYLVKWRGYGEEHNSWVDERDAGNATELIELFWTEKRKNKPGPRKSEPVKTKPKPVDKPSRKSLADVDSSVEVETTTKKRGRPRKDELSSDKVEDRDDDDDDDDDHRAKKKPRRSNGHPRKNEKVESDEEEPLGNMKKHMKVLSWEELIETIDTVEREDEDLYVYFTLKADKKRVRENSRLCAQKFPQKLIMFYESNLRWKTEEANVPAEEVA